MDLSALSGVASSNYASSSTKLTSSDTIGKTEFLKLLTTQLTNQDPTNPMDNKDLILQLSQFSTLEATTNLNNNMESYIYTNGITSASSLIGKEVAYYDSDTGSVASGVASQMIMNSDGSPTLQVGTKYIPLKNVLGIAEQTAAASGTSSTETSNT